MQSSDSNWLSMAVMNWRSGLGLVVAEAFHWTGVPAPLGNTATNPSFCPSAPNIVVAEWITAPSERPWKSTTSGLGIGVPAVAVDGLVAVSPRVVGEGVLRRYQRDVPSTSMSCRWLVTGPLWGLAHPAEATGGPVATSTV